MLTAVQIMNLLPSISGAEMDRRGDEMPVIISDVTKVSGAVAASVTC